MGWATGSEIAERVWKEIKPYIKEKDLPKVVRKLYSIFTWYDADDWYIEEGNLAYYYTKENEPELFKEWLEERE